MRGTQLVRRLAKCRCKVSKITVIRCANKYTFPSKFKDLKYFLNNPNIFKFCYTNSN